MHDSHQEGPFERWLNRAGRISDAYGLVLLLTLATFVALSLLPTTGWARVAGVVLAGITSIVGLTSSDVDPGRIRVAGATVIVAVAAAVVAAVASSDPPQVLASLLIVVLLTITGGTILKRVLLAPNVTFRTILGALTTYAMLGLLFGFLYVATSIVQDTPFFTGVDHPGNGEFLFFSYTTLTTTGYGNLVPDGQPGQVFAVFEMLTGQVFLVTLVAGLVSLWRPGSRFENAEKGSGGVLHRMRNELDRGEGGE